MKNITIKCEPLHIDFTPYALARMSNDLYKLIQSYCNFDMPILEYLLYCTSIELGLKASILSVNNSKAMKKRLKKKIGHDLIKASNLFLKNSKNILLDKDLKILDKINPFYKNKGLEYITLDVITALANGLSGFPDIKDIRRVGFKINKLLVKKKMYINI